MVDFLDITLPATLPPEKCFSFLGIDLLLLEDIALSSDILLGACIEALIFVAVLRMDFLDDMDLLDVTDCEEPRLPCALPLDLDLDLVGWTSIFESLGLDLDGGARGLPANDRPLLCAWVGALDGADATKGLVTTKEINILSAGSRTNLDFEL